MHTSATATSDPNAMPGRTVPPERPTRPRRGRPSTGVRRRSIVATVLTALATLASTGSLVACGDERSAVPATTGTPGASASIPASTPASSTVIERDVPTRPNDTRPGATPDGGTSWGRPTVDATGSSGGEQPSLSWAAVAGAATYSVIVHDEHGAAFWGWEGGETEVVVGDGAPSPVVSSAMTWSVVALDDTGLPIAESSGLPI